MKLVLSTGNIMGAGPSIRRSTANNKSNAELVSSLRANFDAHSRSSDLTTTDDGSSINGDSSNNNSYGYRTFSSAKADYKSWTRLVPDSNTLEIPALDFTSTALQEERDQYDITLKLFYLPGTSASPDCRESHTRSALALVCRDLHVKSIDLLIVSFPGMYFDEEEDCLEKLATRDSIPVSAETLASQVATWRFLETLRDEGLVRRLGVAEFGHERLQAFLEHTRIKPSVDQINLRDCCSVPKDLMALAKSQGVELLVHNDCSDILPSGTLRELLGGGQGGAGVLAATATMSMTTTAGTTDQEHGGLEGDVLPQWVVKYTAVVKDRGVVENKGYIALAEMEG